MEIMDLFYEVRGKSNHEIRAIVQKMVKSGELDDLIYDQSFELNEKTGEISWNCYTHGHCTAEIWEVFYDDGVMLERFHETSCGFCKAMEELDGEFDFENLDVEEL